MEALNKAKAVLEAAIKVLGMLEVAGAEASEQSKAELEVRRAAYKVRMHQNWAERAVAK